MEYHAAMRKEWIVITRKKGGSQTCNVTPNSTRATLPCDDRGRDSAYFSVGRVSVGWEGWEGTCLELEMFFF